MADLIHLRFKRGNDKPQFEPVEAEYLDGGAYLVLASPNFVYGIAAGDEIEVEQPTGYFQLLARGGNMAIRVFSEAPLGEAFDLLVGEVEAQLGGRIDGRLTRSAAFTVPTAAGFDEVEAVFYDFTSAVAGTIWEYGNVYDDDGEPLEWWL